MRVREARKLSGLSQEDLAAQIGVSRGAVAQWEMENGTSPAVDNMVALARVSGMCFEYLATGRGPRVFGAPLVAEEPSEYRPLSTQQRQWLDLFDAMSPRRREAALLLIKGKE